MKLYWSPLTNYEARGYGRISVQLANATARAGIKLMRQHEIGWDWIVVPSTPFAGMLNRDGSVRSDLMWHTMFDADLLPVEWARDLNRSGAVWVPSRWCYETFKDSGIIRPIIVAGYGVDCDVFKNKDRAWLADMPLTFITPSLQIMDRKNSYTVLKAWHKLQLKDARLIVKVNQGPNVNINGMDNVITVKDNLTDPEWAELMHNADCLVYPSSGEGFGLMPLEYAATGGLAIATDYAGIKEYVHDVPMLPLKVKALVPAESYNYVYPGEARWAEPDLDDLCDKMKWVAENREQAWQLGQDAAARVREHWTWDDAGKRAKLALEAL